MTVVSFERVVSVNSEDPAYPAENLLKSDNTKKWKCKTGEKQATVILQLKKDTLIEGIDIGNEHSAFVEVLVGKSSSPNSDFKVLLVASSLMTLREAKDGTNTNSVRFFKKSDLTKPAADEKWDRIKIVCTQPFNKHVQYGLSFIVLHTVGASGEEESSQPLGRFTLKEDDEKDSPVAVGSWFAKRKDPPPSIPPGAAAAIRDASSPVSIAQGKNKKPISKRPKITTPKNAALKPGKNDSLKPPSKRDSPNTPKPALHLNMSLGEEDSPADDTDADSTYSPNKDSTSILSDDDVILSDSDGEVGRKRPKRIKKDTTVKDVKNGTVLNGKTIKPKKDPDIGKAKAAKMAKTTKPFGRLLEGVTIVISGYQNPLRGELRSKACAMGAKYKADWDNTCTHLICAFVNTPKFNQVKGRGKIVKRQWVEECHNRRRRIPWRRYALDRDDEGTSSEEEIWEEESIPTTSSIVYSDSPIASGVNRRRVSSGSDTEEEIERVKARQVAIKLNATSVNSNKQTREESKGPLLIRAAGGSDDKKDPFSADTDVDSDTDSQTADLPLPTLPDFFHNIVFHIAADIDEYERRLLHRYITAYDGRIVNEVDGSVEYVVTKLSEVADQVGEEFGISSVSPDWIWACSDAEKIVSNSTFRL